MTLKKRRRGKLGAVFTVMVALGFFLSGGLILWAATLDIPDLRSFDQRKIEQSTKIYDRTGEVLLYDLHANIRRTVVPFDSIARHAKNATVAIEDAEFYEHNGVKPTAFLRAVIVNLFALDFEQGGSTITQQVVKNSLLTQEKLISRKIKEWVLALKLEQEMSKEQILEIYLNESPYGGSIYGIEEASRSFFDKSAVDLTLAESAYLAALPQAPTYYSPYGNNLEALEARKNLVLSRMLSNNFITKDEYDAAKAETVEFQPRREQGILAPHFVFYVREQLEVLYGKRALEERGMRVITSIDWELQEKAQEIVKEYALSNEERFNAENAGLVAIDPQTGEVLVMVGSRDYFDENIDGNVNVALAHRQPGSAFKPFVYAAALEKGYTPETVVFDVPTQFSTACSPDNFTSEGECYSPGNYDHTFRGPVTFRNALAQSINVPAVKALYLAGLPNSLRLAKDLGITTLTDASRYGLTLVLGGGEVRLLDMTSAYGVFANDGVRNEPVAILRVEDTSGNVTDEFEANPEKVLEPEIARQISDMLSDNVARTPLFGANSPLHFPGRDVAAKTGTTNDLIDAWIVGYTPNLAVGVWAGNNTPESMTQISGLIVTPMWRAFMDVAMAKRPEASFIEPRPSATEGLKPVLRGSWQGGESYFVDTISGKLATEYTPPETKEERFNNDVHSTLYWVQKDDPQGPKPANPSLDPQFPFWEYGVLRWLSQNPIGQSGVRPTETDDVHIPQNFPRVSIVSPANNEELEKNQRTVVSIQASGAYPARSADFFINNSFVGSSNQPPFTFSFVPAELPLPTGNHTLRVVLKDHVYNKTEASVSFSVQ